MAKITLTAYRSALRAHDWFWYEQLDPAKREAGRSKQAELEAWAAELDADRTIWNQIMPQNFHVASGKKDA